MVKAMRQVEVLRAACCVAGADGQASEKERAILRELASHVGVGEASLSAMIERAETDRDFWKEQFQVLKADPPQTLKLLFRVAVADGRLKKEECLALKRLARQLDVDDEEFERWLTDAIAGARNRGP